MKYLVAALIAAVLFVPSVAQAHYSPGGHNAKHAITLAWCGSYKECVVGNQAIQVAGCETGWTYSVWAQNGQFLGIFQMGSSERKKYGHGNDPWTQARSAHKYWRVSGWYPWPECGAPYR